MTHSFQEMQAAGQEHEQLVLFLEGCAQSKIRNQPVRLAATLNNKERAIHASVGELGELIAQKTQRMRSLEKEFNITNVVIGEKEGSAPGKVQAVKENVEGKR